MRNIVKNDIGYRILSIFMAAVMIISMMPIGVFASSNEDLPDIGDNTETSEPIVDSDTSNENEEGAEAPDTMGELVWSTTVPESIAWNDPSGFVNTVSGGLGDGIVTYSSDNTDVADVDTSTGVLTLKKPGTVTITATKDSSSEYYQQTTSYTLLVVAAKQAPLVFDESNPNAIYYGDSYVNRANGGSTGEAISYSSSDESIATVDQNGNVTALKQGVVTITAKLAGDEYYEDAIPASYTITILRAPQVSELIFEKGTAGQKIKYGDEYINAVVSGGNTAPVTYSSSDTSVAVVDYQTGEVTALKAGNVTITATAPQTEQYEEQTLSYVLEIELADHTVEFENGTTNIPTITYGESYQNKASAKTDITYTSSDDSVAEVDHDGKLTIHKAGTVTITATAAESELYKESFASYTITVNKALQTITFEKGYEVTVVFNDNGNEFVNLASSNALSGDDEDKKDIEALYSIIRGEEFVDNTSFDSATGEFIIIGAGEIEVKVTFSGNDRYSESSISYKLTVEKDDQTIAFDQPGYELINGNDLFQAPVITTLGAGSGEITYSIESDPDDVLSDIVAATGELAFTHNVGTVTILAKKAADDNYNEAEARYTLTVLDWCPEEPLYILDGANTNGEEWYTGNVSVVAKEGYLLSYERTEGYSDWLEALTDSVTSDGVHTVEFYIQNTANGNISEKQTIIVHKDATVPVAVVKNGGLSNWEKILSVVTLGLWEPDNITFTVESDDVTSGVEKVEYYVSEGTTSVMDKDSLDLVSTWSEYVDKISVEKNKIFVVYAKVTDKAGNYVYASTNGIVFDRAAVPEENITVDIVTENKNGFYNTDVNIDVTVSDPLPSSGIGTITYEVLNNNVQTQEGILYEFDVEDPDYSDLVPSWSGEITVDAENNNSDNVIVKITVVDNSGNSTTKEIPLKICVDVPTVDFEYIEDPDAVDTHDGIVYHAEKRSVKIVITGRTSVFEASDAPVITVNESMGDTANRKTYEIVDWTTEESEDPDKATHTLFVNFNGNARYSFDMRYTDIFGNELKFESEKFAVDMDLPTARIVIDESNTWTILIETLSFGLWKNEGVTVKADAQDSTGEIKSLEYYITNSKTALTTTDLKNVGWMTFSPFTLEDDGEYTVYLKAEDYAGHTKYVSSDGYIIDMENSDIVITPDDPNENGIYGGDFDVRIDVEDKISYSGIKSVEYWITNNGVETVRENLYSFEYERYNVENSNRGNLRIYEDGVLVVEKNDIVLSYSDLRNTFSKTITVDSKVNNSDFVSIFVKVIDNAGNEMISKIENLKVDATAPVINISFDNNDGKIRDGRGYFDDDRTATVVFTERTSSFNREDALAGIKLAGWDVNKNPVVFDRDAMIEWGETVEIPENPDAATHTVYIHFATDANYDFTVSYTDLAGHECSYDDVKFASGTVAKREFTIDKEIPEYASVTVGDKTWEILLKVLTFKIYKADMVSVSATAKDVTSPVDIYYHMTDDVIIKDWAQLDSIADWKEYSEFDVSTDKKFVIYLKVVDYAGNYIYVCSDGQIVDMTKAEITLTPEHTDRSHNGIPLYNKDVNVDIQVNEKKSDAYSGIKKVEYWIICDGEETKREVLYTFENNNPTYADLLETYSDTVTIKSEKNNSCDVVLYVGVTDNSGNYQENSVAVDIDITKPVIEVKYDNNSAYKIVGEKGYYPAERSATVSIIERKEHFDPTRATNDIIITASDVSGSNAVANTSDLVSSWKTVGIGESAVHTATVDFSADANYTFDISYTDLASNINEYVNVGGSVTPYVFAVDKNEPYGSVSAGELGTWDKLVDILTFGLWSREAVSISVTAGDATTAIESISCYKSSDTVGMTYDQLDAMTSWTSFDDMTIPVDERVVVYVKIVDDAGNKTYISTNGIIVDMTDPQIESVKPEITLTPEASKGMYNSNVAIAVSVMDPGIGETEAYSGLKEIKYEVFNMGEITQSGVLYSFDIDDPTHDELIQSWEKNDAIIVDKDLNNSNDVKIVVYAVDNVGNFDEEECNIKIDVTSPTIRVTYDNNDGDASFADKVFFGANRTAEITITERNFDPELVKLTITNTDGYVPQITGWKTVAASGNGDKSTHTAYVVFDKDGDYTFDISCVDTATNANGDVSYGANLAPTSFTIDKTVPVIKIAYDNNEVFNGNYYRNSRVATLTVTEHNFETGRVVVKLRASDNGVESAIPTISQWTSNGDVHTATIRYSEDGLYVFDFDYRDQAGNASADIAEQSFYIDKTAPVVTIKNIVDESANNTEDDIGFVITATDTNFDVFVPSVVAVVKNGNTFETKQLDVGKYSNIANGKVFTVSNLDTDGVYRINCNVVDKAGNAYSSVILENATGEEYIKDRSGNDSLVTFSVNREGSTFELGENTMWAIEKEYVQALKDDVVVVEINVDPLMEYNVTLNGKNLSAGTDYTVSEEGGDGSWMKYTYKVNKDLFDTEGEYKLVVSSKDKADNDAFSDVKDATVSLVVDRTAPQVTVSGLSNNGRYQTESQAVTLIPTDDGGSLKSITVCTVDEDGNVIEKLVDLSGEAFANELEAQDGKIMFEVSTGLYQNVQIICDDQSVGETQNSNVYDVTFKNISVSSSMFMIFWANKPLRWGVIGAISLAGVGSGIFAFAFKKKRKI